MTREKDKSPWGHTPDPPSPPYPSTHQWETPPYTEGGGFLPTAILNFTQKQNYKDHTNINIFAISVI